MPVCGIILHSSQQSDRRQDYLERRQSDKLTMSDRNVKKERMRTVHVHSEYLTLDYWVIKAQPASLTPSHTGRLTD